MHMGGGQLPEPIANKRDLSPPRGKDAGPGDLAASCTSVPERERTMKSQLTFAAIAVVLLVAGWWAGAASNVVEAQSQDALETTLSEGYEWRMFGGNVAGTGGSGGSGGSDTYAGSIGSVGLSVRGATWLYNTNTGKVYRVWERCNVDEGGGSGCLIAAPVFSADRLDRYLPNPATDDDPPGFER